MAISEIPENKIKPPVWMDKVYLAKVLQEGLNCPQLELISYTIKPATNVGDNYASLMFRASLNFVKTPASPEETISVVIKTIPRGKVEGMMTQLSIFEKEAAMFTTVLPKMNEALQAIYPNQDPLSAKCFWVGTEPEDVIILQDLKELGFDNADRMNGLDLEMVNIVLTSLAKFHATSLLILQEQPHLVERFKENIFSAKNEEMFKPMFTSGLKGLLKEVNTWDDIPREYIDKLNALELDVFMSRTFDAGTTKDGSLNVLQHGDCWINNFMFAKGEKFGFRFVDFQIGYLSSGALDLNYFLFTSPSPDIRISKIDQFLKTYYDTFMQTVNDLGVDLPKSFTLEELKREFNDRLFFGFMAMTLIYPITVCPPKNAPDVNDFFEDDRDTSYLYQTDTFKKIFKIALPYFVENGAI